MITKNDKNVIGVYKNNTPISKIYKSNKLVFGQIDDNLIFEYVENPCNFYINDKLYTPTQSPAIFAITEIPSSFKWEENSVGNLTKVQKLPNTSNITDFGGFFAYATGLTSIEWGDFSTVNATKMDEMFYGCLSLTELDLSAFDTSNVTNMSYMIYSCHALNNIQFPANFGAACTNMAYMFAFSKGLTSLDVSSWNTSKVINMDAMFLGCANLQTLDLTGWDTSNVKHMRNMFANCTSLESLKLGYIHCPTIDSNMLSQSPLKVLEWDNLGEAPNYQTSCGLNLSAASELGAGQYHQQFVDTFITKSFDRASAGMESFTIQFHADVESNISAEEIAQMTSKNYSISF